MKVECLTVNELGKNQRGSGTTRRSENNEGGVRIREGMREEREGCRKSKL